MRGDRRELVILIAGILFLLAIPAVVAFIYLREKPPFLVDARAFSSSVGASEIIRKEAPGFYNSASQQTGFIDDNRGVGSLHIIVSCGGSKWGGFKELKRLREVYARVVCAEMARYGFTAHSLGCSGSRGGRDISNVWDRGQIPGENPLDEMTMNEEFLFVHPNCNNKVIVRLTMRGNERQGVPLSCEAEILLYEIIAGSNEHPLFFK